MSKTFYDKGNDLLKELKIETQVIRNNKDIQESRNFSAVLSTRNSHDILSKRNIPVVSK